MLFAMLRKALGALEDAVQHPLENGVALPHCAANESDLRTP